MVCCVKLHHLAQFVAFRHFSVSFCFLFFVFFAFCILHLGLSTFFFFSLTCEEHFLLGFYEDYTVHVVELFERFTVWDSVALYLLTTLKKYFAIICRLCGNIGNNQLELTKISKAISSPCFFFVSGLEQ